MTLWTPKEDDILSNTLLDYNSIAAMLPHRTKRSIWTRAHKLGYSRELSVISKVNSENQRKEEWNELIHDEEFCETINGELLGDGCISRKKVKNRNCYEYSFITGSIHKEYADYVHGLLSQKLKSKSKVRSIKPSGCGKHIFYSVRFSSVVFRHFYDKWYVDGPVKRTFPKDIELSPKVCLHWYLGDGSLDSDFRRKMFEIVLHTENFIHSDVNKLSQLIENYIGIKSGTKYSKSKYKVIRIHGDHARQFLTYIGHSPVSCFNYKWADWKKGG